MDEHKIAKELVMVAKELTAAPVVYDSKVESKYSKHYQSALGTLMRKPHISYQIEAAKAVYDGTEFINEAGISYKLSVNTSAKKETDIVKVVASKDGKKQIKNIAPNMVPWMLG